MTELVFRSSEDVCCLAGQQNYRVRSSEGSTRSRAGLGKLLCKAFTDCLEFLLLSIFNEKSHHSLYLKIEKSQLNLESSFVPKPNEFANYEFTISPLVIHEQNSL